MKVLIIGVTSGIGSKTAKQMIKQNYSVVGTHLSRKIHMEGCEFLELDITDREKTINLIKNVNPEVTFHTAAVPSVDECETNKEKAWNVNVEGTRNVVDGCKLVDSKIVYISTSAVFEGKKEIYYEDDETNPINNYGLTKLEGEKVVLNSALLFLIARIDHPYGWAAKEQKQNTVTRVLASLEAGKVHEEIINWYNTPTFLDNCAEVIIKLLEKNKVGIYHVVGPDFVNRYEFALKVADVFEYDKNLVKPKSSKTLNLPARRANWHLSSEKAERDSGIKLVGIEEGLRTMKRQREEIGFS